jgi:fatty acid CoA ligase FadD32
MRAKVVAQATEAGVSQRLFEGVASTIRGAVTKGHGVPLRHVVLVEARSLPKTSSGKVMRRQYRKTFERGGLTVLYQADFPSK